MFTASLECLTTAFSQRSLKMGTSTHMKTVIWICLSTGIYYCAWLYMDVHCPYAPELWQKWTFQQKYDNFEKKFPKIDKKCISQSILEVGHFTSLKKVVFFTNLDFLYRKSYSKFDGFWCLLVNLVVFPQIHRNVNFYNELRDEFFIDFGKLFFKVLLFFVGSSFLLSIRGHSTVCEKGLAFPEHRLKSCNLWHPFALVFIWGVSLTLGLQVSNICPNVKMR